jgi:hypothetical protein
MYSRAVDGAAVASSLQQLLEEGGWRRLLPGLSAHIKAYSIAGPTSAFEGAYGNQDT